MSGMRAAFQRCQGDFVLDAAFDAPSTGVTCVLGPSGCGKTTLLRCIAGLLRPDRGRFELDGAVWADTEQDVFLPPHRRPIGYVFQEPSLFEHLDVRRNIHYGLKRVPASQRRIEVEQIVAWLGLSELMHRDVHGLSGGEKQRVAIARTLATSPQLVLMDEPLSALDEASRDEIIPYLVRLHRELSIPVIYVSHHLREIAQLADYLLVMKDGRIVESGPASPLLESRSHGPWTSTSEATLLRATVAAHDDGYHLTTVDTAFGALMVPRLDAAVGDEVRLHIGARDVSIGLRMETDTSMLNQVHAVVAAVDAREPGQVMVTLSPRDGDEPRLFAVITQRSCDALGLRVGSAVVARIKGVNVTP